MEEEGGKKLRGRNRGGRSRGGGNRASNRGRIRGRARRAVKIIESDDEDSVQNTDENIIEANIPDHNHEEELRSVPLHMQQQIVHNVHQVHPPQTINQPQQLPEQHFDLEADISQLEAPTFTTINRGPPEPMLRLRWDHRVNLIGEKVLNPMIHCCDKCSRPILIYGRMIPCKHVFCLSCAKREDKVCPRCLEKVSRVEQTGLGTVFMCTHGGTRYGNAGCRRTYLSQRDLQAHINHRHVSAPPQSMQNMQIDSTTYIHPKSELDVPISKGPGPMTNNRMKSLGAHMVPPIMGNDPRVNSMVNQQNIDHRSQHRSQNMMSYSQSTVPPQPTNVQMRSNLITVPIQDNTDIHSQQGHHYYQSVQSQVNYGYNVNVPSVAQNQQYYSQPQMAYPAPAQQQYVNSPQSSIRSATSGYVQDSQYGPPPQQPPPPPPQTQWNQHQQQFYR